jgi:DNA-binding NarL/FixJ family response regulator
MGSGRSGLSMVPRLRIVVVDDHPLLRGGVVDILRNDGRFEVVGEGGSADCAETLARDLAPDVVVLDVRMPGGGLEAIERVLRADPRAGVVMLTVEDEIDLIEDAFRRGARGYVVKTAGAAELVETVLQVARGDLYLAPQLAGRMVRRMSSARDEPVAHVAQGFTEREEQIMGFLIHGLSNKEIAYRLSLSEKTVKFYVTHVIKKLGVKNRVQVALYASRRAGSLGAEATEV